MAEVWSDWSYCAIVGTTRRQDLLDEKKKDPLVDVTNPEVIKIWGTCCARPRQNGTYINGGCPDCLLKIRMNLEELWK